MNDSRSDIRYTFGCPNDVSGQTDFRKSVLIVVPMHTKVRVKRQLCDECFIFIGISAHVLLMYDVMVNTASRALIHTVICCDLLLNTGFPRFI